MQGGLPAVRLHSLVGGLGRWKGGLGNPKGGLPGTKGGLGNPKGGLPSQPLSHLPNQSIMAHVGACFPLMQPHYRHHSTRFATPETTSVRSTSCHCWTMTKTTSKNLDLHCFSSICGMTTSKVQNCLHCFFSLCGIAGP